MNLYENYDRSVHRAGLTMKDCRLSVHTAVSLWDLEHQRGPDQMMREIRKAHVREAAELVVKRHTMEHHERLDTGEKIISTHCIVMSLADFGKVVDAEVQYRMENCAHRWRYGWG